MTLMHTSAVQLSRAVGAAAVSALVLGLGGALGCSSPYPTFKSVPIDCTADSGYDFAYLPGMTNLPVNNPPSGSGSWWGAGDTPPPDGGTSRAYSTIEEIPDGGRCSSTTADVLHSSYYNDWGSLFGYNNLSATGAEAYEGLSFWARGALNTTKGFTLLLDDDNTASGSTTHNCKSYNVDGGVAGQGTGVVTTTDPGTGATISSSSASRAPYPDECGNEYSVAMLVTDDWRFYTVPFGEFQQASSPNRVPNAVLTETGTAAGTTLLTDRIRYLLLRMPREALAELWISNLGFYKKKVSAPDAAQP